MWTIVDNALSLHFCTLYLGSKAVENGCGQMCKAARTTRDFSAWKRGEKHPGFPPFFRIRFDRFDDRRSNRFGHDVVSSSCRKARDFHTTMWMDC
jgi:hypothetical protein